MFLSFLFPPMLSALIPASAVACRQQSYINSMTATISSLFLYYRMPGSPQAVSFMGDRQSAVNGEIKPRQKWGRRPVLESAKVWLLYS